MKLRFVLPSLVAVVILLLCCGSLIAAESSKSSFPQIVAARVATAPVMDGKLDDSAWSKASEVDGFILIGTSHRANAQTYVKAVTDGNALYIGFKCLEPKISQVKSQLSKTDENMFLEETAQMELDPTGEAKRYFHIAASIFEQKYGAEFTTFLTGAPSEDTKWGGAWDVKTSRDSKGWYAEFRIPFATIKADPSQKQSFRINFNRIRCIGESETSSWSPTYARFVEPDNMGELIIPGSDGSYCRIAFPRLASIGAGRRDVSLDVINHSKSAIRPKFIYKITGPVTFNGSLALKAIPAAGTRAVRLPLTFSRPGNYVMHAQAVDAITGKTLYSLNRKIEVTQSIAFDEALYALYYKRADATLDVRVPTDNAKLKVSLLKKGSDIPLGSKIVTLPVSGPVKVSFDMSRMSEGAYVMRAEVIRGGKSFASSDSRIFPYNPKPKVGLNKDGFLLVDGKPFFPIGIYNLRTRLGTPTEKIPEITENIMRESAQAGFNSTVLYDYEPPFLDPLLDACERNGIKAFVYPTVPFHKRKGAESPDTIRRDMDTRKNHPAVIGWYVVDEPEGIGMATVKPVVDEYHTIKEYDTEHPCAIVIMTPPAAKEYRSATDIMWADPYPVPTQQVSYVGEVVSGTIRNIEKDKPMWDIPQAFDWNAFNGKFDGVHRPNPVEVRCLTYMPIVNGAKGLIYWAHTAGSYYIQDYPEFWTAVKGIAGELRTLSPVLTTPTVAGKLSVTAKNNPIQTMLKKVNGEWYAFAVNSKAEPCEAAFKLTGLASGDKLDVMFENRSLTIEKGGWNDSFKPLDVHIYRVSAR